MNHIRVMDRDLLKTVIIEQKEIQLPKNFFERTQTEYIRSFVNDPNIIILSGIRRSGKSTIMRVIQKEADKSDYSINFDDDRLVQFELKDFQVLFEVFVELYGKQNTFYFDEIQNISGWETFVRRLHEQGYKIFITGSNATLLSSELGTRLTGRFIPIEIFPLSYKELLLHEYPQILDKKALTTVEIGMALRIFAQYFEFGGIPEFVKFGKKEYLKSLFEGILYRDVIARYGITNEKSLKELIYYLASNIGKEFSYNNLGKTLGIASANTVSGYCDHIENSYLCFFLQKYSHSVHKQIQSNKKCYMIDNAIIRLIGFRTGEDRGRLLENIVFLHLRMQERDIFFHKEKRECDFIIRQGSKIVKAVQVATSMSNPDVREREVEGLVEAMEVYELSEGLILTENEQEELLVERNGCRYSIHIKPIWKWLLD